MAGTDKARARRQRLAICMPLAACATAAAVIDTAFIGAKVSQPQAPTRLPLVANFEAPVAAAAAAPLQSLGLAAPSVLAAAACLSAFQRRREESRRSRHVCRFFGGKKKDGEAEDEEGEEELTPADLEAIEKVQGEIDELVQLKEEKLAAQARLQIENDNFRKRTRDELAAARSKAAVPVVKELLAIADEYEYAKQNLKTETDGEKAVTDGFDSLYTDMLETWKKVGVEKMEATGEEFNPELHEAVSMIPSEEYSADKVCNVLRAGWVQKSGDNQEVLRPALVCVSAGPGPA